MKRILLILMLVSICIYVAYAQENNTKTIIIKKNATGLSNENVKLIMDNAGDMDPKIRKNIQLTINEDSDEEDGGAFIGIFTEDMTLDQAYQKGYREFYGILITGISQNTPAQKYKLMVDDILMKIDENKIANKDQLLKIMQSYAPGDAAQLSIFRNNELKVIPFTFGSKSKPEVIPGVPVTTKKKISHSVGYGGGSWTPDWFMLNTDDVNYVIANAKDSLGTGFSEISSKGLFMSGGGGKGNVGKGFFIGGMGAGYSLEKNYMHADSTHKMKYTVSFGGVTLDKRIHIAHHLTGSIGFLLGGGQQTVNITRQKYVYPAGGYDWDYIPTVNLVKDEVNMSRNYLVVQPKAEVLYHILSWLAFRGEVGYMMGYSVKDGWEVTNNSNAQVNNSPNTALNGLTFSVGPWFGF